MSEEVIVDQWRREMRWETKTFHDLVRFIQDEEILHDSHDYTGGYEYLEREDLYAEKYCWR